MMSTTDTCGLRRLPTAALAGLILLASTPAWSATTLSVTSDGLLSLARDGQPASLELRIHNRGSAPLSQLNWHVSTGQSVSCAASTDFGQAFHAGGTLAAGDGVSCSVPANTPGRSVSAAVAVTATQADGTVQIVHSSLSQRTLRAPINQAALVVLGAAVHADANSNGLLNSGETLAYHYTVYNAGTLPLTAVSVSDASGAVTCPQTTLAVAASLVCTRSYVITAADQTAGLVVNPVDADATASSGAVSGGDVLVSVNLAGSAGIRVFKSPALQDDVDADGRASVGDLVRYTFLVKNSNAQALSGVTLIEPDPTRIDTPITCTATLGGQAFALNGNLVSTDTALCTADYTIRAADQTLGQASNLVEARANAALAGPITATGASTVVIPANPQIQVSKTVNVGQTLPGGSVVYTITVRNVGTVDAGNVLVSDPLPQGITAFAWTCAASAGATCPTASGSGAINQTVTVLPAGGQLVYTVTATVAANAPTTVTNQVTVTPPGSTVCLPAATPGPCRASIPLIVNVPYVAPQEIPVDSRWALLILVAAIIATATRRRAR